jgi:hypothetical protein
VVKHPNVASTHDDLAAAVCGAIVACKQALSFTPLKIAMPVVTSRPCSIPGGSMFARDEGKPAYASTPPPGFDKRSCDEPWYPYVMGRRRKW